MKPWSVREEANSALLWQAVMEHSLLPHLTQTFAGDMVQCTHVRGEHLVPSAPCPFSQVCHRGRKKDVKRKRMDVSDTRMNCQRPPDQGWFLQRPCCRNCLWQGCVTPTCEKAVLLGEGAQSGLVLQSQTSHLCGRV